MAIQKEKEEICGRLSTRVVYITILKSTKEESKIYTMYVAEQYRRD